MTMISYALRNTREKCWLKMILSSTIRFVEFKVPMESGFFLEHYRISILYPDRLGERSLEIDC